MRKEYKLILMNGLFSKNIEVTTEDLTKCRFSSTEITRLIEEGLLTRVSKGVYKDPNSLAELINKGEELRAANDLKGARRYFEKCFHMKPNDIEINLLLFEVLVSMQQYEAAFNLLGRYAIESKDELNLPEVKLYLYLLMPYVEFDEEEKEEVRNISIHTLLFDEESCDFDNPKELNRIIGYAYRQEYAKAMNLLNKSESSLSFEYKLIRKLIKPMFFNQKKYYSTLKELIENREYENIINFLSNKDKNSGLSPKEGMVLTIAKDIVEINNTQVVPTITDYVPINLRQAINGKNYKMALEMINEFNEKNNVPKEQGVVNFLLVDINTLIDSLEDKKEGSGYKSPLVKSLFNKKG